MSSSAPRIVSFTNNQGSSGSVVRGSLLGTGLDTVAAILFTGPGVVARILYPRRDDRIDVAVSIAPDAAPGPRGIVLRISRDELTESRWPDVLFYVSPSGYASKYGIGSHLI